MKKIYVIIPAYNESRSVGKIVKEIRENIPGTRVLVVDDGSSDGTEETAKKYGAITISHPTNRGCAMAVAAGLKYVSGRNARVVILMDADGQHDPGDVPFLMHSMETMHADMIIGSRYLNRTDHVTSWSRRMGTRLISVLIRLKHGCTITDPTSGFRILGPKAVALLNARYPIGFSEPEAVILLISSGLKITEVPIQMKKRIYGKSSISSGKAFRLMLYIFQKILLTHE